MNQDKYKKWYENQKLTDWKIDATSVYITFISSGIYENKNVYSLCLILLMCL